MASLRARPLRIVCADWSKERSKRAAYEAIVSERAIRRVRAGVREVEALLGDAASGGVPTIVAFDAPLGIPESFARAAGARGFVDWMLGASLEQCAEPGGWCVEAPFFAVPKGRGSLGRFREAARRRGVELLREIERKTNGKPAFITSGIPGSVGSATRDLWRGLVAARRSGADFRLWPFEEEDATAAEAGVPIVAETYPRAAYATALVDEAPRSRMRLAKTDRPTRERAIDRLLATRWTRSSGVAFEDLAHARASEDEFDAMITAAALLRCVVEGLPLHAAPIPLPAIEGAILGTGSVDLSLPEVAFGSRLPARRAV